MATFTVTLYEIAAHTFTVDASDEEAAVKLARAEFDAHIDSETCISLGLDPGRPPTVYDCQCRAPEYIDLRL